MNLSELEKAIPRAEERVARLKAALDEKRGKARSDKREKLLKAALEAQGEVNAAKKESDDAAARLAALQAELAKLDDPDKPND